MTCKNSNKSFENIDICSFKHSHPVVQVLNKRLERQFYPIWLSYNEFNSLYGNLTKYCKGRFKFPILEGNCDSNVIDIKYGINLDCNSNWNSHMDRHKANIPCQFIFLSEESWLFLEKCKNIQRNEASKIIQRAWRKFYSYKVMKDIRHSVFHLNCGLEKVPKMIATERSSSELIIIPTSQYKMKNEFESHASTVTGITEANMAKSSPSGTVSNNHSSPKKKKKHKQFTSLYIGNGIISKRPLAQIPIRFHTKQTSLPYSYVVPHDELPKGLQDALM